jgi:dCMP deaminase
VRKDKTKYYLDIAECVATRSTCIRRQYGAVIVKNDEIISTGYNGSPRGEANCCDVGECWRESNNIPHGEQYEKCVAVHAEQNAIISAPRSATFGAVLYLAGLEDGRVIDAAPCDICQRLIKNAGITAVISTRKHELAFDAPAVDAVPVVRCKDCKHYDSMQGECYGQDFIFTEDGSLYVGEEDFCSYGERKEE